MSSAKIGVHGLEYAYIGDQLSFGEETPEYRCTFYAGSFHHMSDPVKEAQKPDLHGKPSAFPAFYWPRKEIGEPDNGSHPKQKYKGN